MNPLKNVSNLKREDNSIWKPINNKRKTQTITTPITQIFNTSRIMGKKQQGKS
jgi:hypothetical protein